MIEICPKDKCTGCKACMSSCSHGAISFIEDEMGFWYPKVDQTLCVDCGLCAKICPSNSLPAMNSPLESFVGYANDDKEQVSSTSGGIASAICRNYLKNGGIVYACSSEYPEIGYIRATTESDISLIKGSKYVQADTKAIFTAVKQDLKDYKVVFIGTPCICSGLRKYLRIEYENLIVVDFVCHGVPSQRLLKDAVHNATKENVSSIMFRRKTHKGKSQYGLFLYRNDGTNIFSETYPDNDYITGFLAGIYYRESCYNCNYSCAIRCSDLTLGDFWNRDNEFPKDNKFGLSMILVNTIKGMNCIKDMNSNLILSSITIDKLILHNAQLHHPMRPHPMKDKFRKIYLESGWSDACKVCLNDEKKRVRKSLKITRIRNIIYKIPGTRRIYKLLSHSIKGICNR